MDTEVIEVDRTEAHRMWQKYQTHKHHQTPIDAEIEHIYRTIAKGKLVIRALASIITAGVDTKGMPKLALARADATVCHCWVNNDGSARMSDSAWINGRTAKSRFFNFQAGSFNGRGHRSGKAIVPHVPPDIRPARGIQNYHILFEAVWEPIPPVDPLLLRRIGKGDTWLVVGVWELTDVERAAMAARL